MKLTEQTQFGFKDSPFIGRLEARTSQNSFSIKNLTNPSSDDLDLRIGAQHSNIAHNEIVLPADSAYLDEGDIVRFNPVAKESRVLYRKQSQHNSLFITERCNSRCIMCSQPPRNINDDYLIDDILTMIPWMAKETSALGISGGEPTLLHERLLEVIRSTKLHLPNTYLHMLSNGRLFSYVKYAQQLASIEHPNFMIGIPLYADTASAHDYVVQSKGAFEQTLFGVLNLARTGIRIELRMVLHQVTYPRLPQFARFVARNLPFVDHVAFMGLEFMGYARSNMESLWVDPVAYQPELDAAIQILDDAGMQTSIYNHQLCLLPAPLHRFSRKSISDWKNTYMPVCEPCQRKSECGGFFASATLRYSSHIKPFCTDLPSEVGMASKGTTL